MASPFGGFVDLSAYSPDAIQRRRLVAEQNSALNNIISGINQGIQLQQLPQTLRDQELARQLQNAINQQKLQDVQNPQLQALKQAAVQQALTQQGIFSPTPATATTPAALPAIPLTYEEQRAMAPYLPGTPEAIATQAPVLVPENIAPQDIRATIPLGNGIVQAPEIATQNLNESIRRAMAQKQNEALMKPMVVDKNLILPRGPSGQPEVLYAPPTSPEEIGKLSKEQKSDMNTILDNMRQDTFLKNYNQIKGEEQRMQSALNVGQKTGNYFGTDLALADQFIRGVNGNYAIRQGTQKILLSEQPIINRLLGTMRSLVMGTGGQGFTDSDRQQLLKLSKAFTDSSLEEAKQAFKPYLAQFKDAKIPTDLIPGYYLYTDKADPLVEDIAQPTPSSMSPEVESIFNQYK